MKTANEIQLDALAESYDDLCFEVDAIKTQVENIIHLLESHHEREAVVNYAKRLLDDIVGMVEDKEK